MSQRSEQTLSSLEHSTHSTLELLPEAIDALGLRRDAIRYEFVRTSPTSKSDVGRFREQWVLKWLIKRLQQITATSNQSEARVLLRKTDIWALLGYLLAVVPRSVLQDILFERNFCHALAQCLRILNDTNEEQRPALNGYSSSLPTDDDSGRPKKKRRLSVEGLEDDSGLPRLVCQLLLRLANVFSSAKQDDQANLRGATTRWATSVEVATTFVGQTIRFVTISSKRNPYVSETEPDTIALTMLQNWLRLWQDYGSLSYKGPNEGLHIAFNENVLVNAMTLLGRNSHFEAHASLRALQRLIAIHTVLPVREIYYKRTKTRKAADNDPEGVKMSMEILRLWGSSTRYLDNANRATILATAGRLVPEIDVAKRKSEGPWLEMLFYTLSRLSPALEDKVAKGVAPEDHFDLQIQEYGPLLDALEALRVQPQTSLWERFIRTSILSQDIQPDLTARVVRLGAAVFVPSPKSEGVSLLDLLGERISERTWAEKDEVSELINGVLIPIVESAAKSKQLSTFILFWQKQLTEGLADDAAARAKASSKNQRTKIWDDPALLKHFETTCTRYNLLPFCRDVLQEVATDIEALSTLSGPTHAPFGRITVLSRIFKAMCASPVGHADLLSKSVSISSAVQRALERENDYQGHRWLLWQLLERLVMTLASADSVEFLHTNSATPLLRLDSVLELREVSVASKASDFQAYSALISTCYQLNRRRYLGIFERLVSAMDTLLDLYCSWTVTSTGPAVSNELEVVEELLSGLLLRLAAVQNPWISGNPTLRHILTKLVRISGELTIKSDPLPASRSRLVSSAFALLNTVHVTSNMDLNPLLVEALSASAESTTSTVPLLVHRFSGWKLSKLQAQKLVHNVIVFMKTESAIFSETTFIDGISVVVRLGVKHRLSQHTSWSEYVALFQRARKELTNTQAVTVFNLMMRLVNNLLFQGVEPASGTPLLVEVLDWAKSRLKKVGSERGGTFRQLYDDFLLLAIISSLNSSNFAVGCEHGKSINKVKSRFRDAVSEILGQTIKRTSGDSSYAMSWIVVHTLISLEPQSNEDLQLTLRWTSEIDTAYSSSLKKDLGSRLHGIASLYSIISAVKAHQSPFSLNALRDSLESLLGEETGVIENYGVREALLHSSGDLAGSEDATKLQIERCMLQLQPVLLRILSPSNGDQQLGAGYSENTKSYLSVAAMIETLTPDELVARPEITQYMARLASLEGSVNERSSMCLMLNLELSKMIFKGFPAIINQNTVDRSLETIAQLVSSASKLTFDDDSESPRPQHIFDRLCGYLSTILINHRRRLKDRHSLLLPALQNLLGCLFCPSLRSHSGTTIDSASKSAFLASLPQWLTRYAQNPHQALPASSAAKFSRLLQSVCEPSTSAARHTLKRRDNPSRTEQSTSSNLNLKDPTRQLRREVSHHLQYLLHTYCHAMLNGYIATDVKEKLMPGMYAVIGCMDIEILRSMNAGMDASQREVWKDLYKDWERWGKWNQK